MTCDETYQGNGEDYTGCQNKTRQGTTCQRWDSGSPHSHRFGYVASGGVAVANYCRNPDGGSSIWCYTTSPDVRWDWCDPLPVSNPELPKPSDPGDPDTCFPLRDSTDPSPQPPQNPGPAPILSSTIEPVDTTRRAATTSIATTSAASTSTTTTTTVASGCGDEILSGAGGADYRGCQNTTRSGYTCQRWDSQSPHSHSRTRAYYPNAGLDANYCRNPDGEPTVWCYTTSENKRWEYCDVSQAGGDAVTTTTIATTCGDEILSGQGGADYRGCQNKTRSGYTCQRWDSQSPHSHSRTQAHYPNAGLDINYCRNPDGEPTIWCYTSSVNKRWEYCDV